MRVERYNNWVLVVCTAFVTFGLVGQSGVAIKCTGIYGVIGSIMGCVFPVFAMDRWVVALVVRGRLV